MAGSSALETRLLDPNFLCFAAVAYERNDQPAKADAALNSAGKLPFVDCYHFRGDVLELRAISM